MIKCVVDDAVVILEISYGHLVPSPSDYVQGIGQEERGLRVLLNRPVGDCGRTRGRYLHSWEDRCLNIKRKCILCISSRGTATWWTSHFIVERNATDIKKKSVLYNTKSFHRN